MHALVVEDDPDIAGLVARYLTRAGYQPTVADSAQSALAVLPDQQWAVAFVDMLLPGPDGGRVIAAIRQLTLAPPCFVVLATVLDRADLTELQPDAIITKPFSTREIRQVLDTVAKAKRASA